ncbi:hypothetical protein SAMN04488595_12412 [Ralstonia sp. 25mfcol4.1]|nr:hypothetical protein SAMN04488595_12412 [Ralstonia sp. 25mfcol4.1]
MTRSSVFVRSDAHSTPLFAVREPIVTPEMSRRCPRELGCDRACSALGPFIAAIFRRTAALSAVHATISAYQFWHIARFGLGRDLAPARREARRPATLTQTPKRQAWGEDWAPNRLFRPLTHNFFPRCTTTAHQPGKSLTLPQGDHASRSIFLTKCAAHRHTAFRCAALARRPCGGAYPGPTCLYPPGAIPAAPPEECRPGRLFRTGVRPPGRR